MEELINAAGPSKMLNYEGTLADVKKQRELIVGIIGNAEAVRDHLFGPFNPEPTDPVDPDKISEPKGFYEKLDQLLKSNQRELNDLNNIILTLRDRV